jgi:hypothetical protein
MKTPNRPDGSWRESRRRENPRARWAGMCAIVLAATLPCAGPTRSTDLPSVVEVHSDRSVRQKVDAHPVSHNRTRLRLARAWAGLTAVFECSAIDPKPLIAPSSACGGDHRPSRRNSDETSPGRRRVPGTVELPRIKCLVLIVGPIAPR